MRTLMGDKPPDYILNVAYTTMRDLLLAWLKPGNILNLIGKPLARDVIGRLPALQTAMSTLLDDFQHGESVFQINVNTIEQRVETLQTTLVQGIRRVVLSVLLVGLLLGSTLVFLIPFEGQVSEFENRAIHLTAAFGFVIGASLTVVVLLYTLWQSLRKPTNR